MNLYEIKELLKKNEKEIFTINEFSRLLNLKKEIAYIYAHRMMKKNLLIKIEKNKYSLTDDPFIIASQLIFPSYISLTSAFYLHNVMQQVIDKIYILTSRQKKQLKTNSLNIQFIKVQPRLMFGYKRIKKGNSFIMLADLEKAILDSLLFLRYCRLPLIIEALKKAKVQKLESYLSLIKNEVLTRRIGYLFDSLRIKHHLKRKNNIIYKLNPSLKKKGSFDKKWYLYVNEDVNQR